MLDGSAARSDDGNVENNNPMTGGDGPNKTRQAILKKGGKKLRATAPLLHHKSPRKSPNNIRLSDHNNNNCLAVSSAAPPGTDVPAGTQPVVTLHHLTPGIKKEVTRFNS